MLSLLSGCTVYRVKVPLEILGRAMEFDLHLRTSGGLDWAPYVDADCKARLGQVFSTIDPLVYKQFLLPIMEVTCLSHPKLFSKPCSALLWMRF